MKQRLDTAICALCLFVYWGFMVAGGCALVWLVLGIFR